MQERLDQYIDRTFSDAQRDLMGEILKSASDNKLTRQIFTDNYYTLIEPRIRHYPLDFEGTYLPMLNEKLDWDKIFEFDIPLKWHGRLIYKFIEVFKLDTLLYKHMYRVSPALFRVLSKQQLFKVHSVCAIYIALIYRIRDKDLEGWVISKEGEANA